MHTLASLVPEMSQMVIYSGVDPDLSRLEGLPYEIRKEILRYVLHSQYARLSRPARSRTGDSITRLRAFDWNIGVLRVCRTLYSDGVDILNRENQWIRIVMYMDPAQFYPALLNHDIQCIRQKAATANIANHLAVVTITPQQLQFPRAETVLLPLEQLVTFCWFLRTMDLGNFMFYFFQFHVPAPISRSLQRQILEPFKPIFGERGEQQVTVTGAVDPNISAQLISAMTPWLGWLRAKGWDIYTIVEGMKADADAAWLDGDLQIAAYKYGQATAFWDQALLACHRDVRGLDEVLDNTQWVLDTICSINQMLAYVRAGEKGHGMSLSSLKQWIEWPRMDNVPTSLKALQAYVHGVDEMQSSKPVLAAGYFRYTLTLCLPEEVPKYRQALVTALGYGSGTDSERAADIKTLIDSLPDKPLPSPVIEPYVSDVAASEKWICRTLGLSSFPEEALRIIKEGITIRLVEGVNTPGEILGLFATEGPDSYSVSDIDFLEVLLHKKMVSYWSATARRGRKPRLCQIGHVRPDILVNAQTETMRMTRRVEIRRGVTRNLKAWVTAPYTHVGQKSVSQDANASKMLLDAWRSRSTADKEKFEKIVEDLVTKHYQSYQ